MKAPQKMPSFARALGVVGLFWWIVFYVYTFHEHRASNPNEHDSAWAFLNELLYPLQMIGVDLLIIFICMACTLRATIKTRHRQWLALAEDEHFGLHSSMGKIETSVIDPMIKKQPSQTKEDQLIGTLSAEFSELIVNFIDQTRRTEPAVANAMRSCLALLCEHQHFPASSQSNDVSILNSSVHPHDASDIKDTMDEREKTLSLTTIMANVRSWNTP